MSETLLDTVGAEIMLVVVAAIGAVAIASATWLALQRQWSVAMFCAGTYGLLMFVFWAISRASTQSWRIHA